MDEPRSRFLPPDPAQCLENDAVRMRAMEQRVHQKIEDAEGYGFSLEEQRMLNTFFDLAEEYDSRRDLLNLSVALPRIFLGHDLRVYLRCGPGQWRLARCLDLPRGLPDMPESEPPGEPAVIGGRFYAPISGRKDTGELLDFPLPGGVLGWVELENAGALTASHRLFYEKFAGRIGHQLHARLVRAKNREHLAFIQNLVADIGHNVIVPNMTFKLFFNRLRGSITALERLLREAPEGAPPAFLQEIDAL